MNLCKPILMNMVVTFADDVVATIASLAALEVKCSFYECRYRRKFGKSPTRGVKVEVGEKKLQLTFL